MESKTDIMNYNIGLHTFTTVYVLCYTSVLDNKTVTSGNVRM